MSSYVTQDGFRSRYGEEELLALTDRDDDGAPDASVWDAAVADTRAEVDSYLGARYQLPLETVPEAVTAAAYKILRYRLNPYATEESSSYLGYQEATAWLRRVSRGEVSLGLPEDLGDAVGTGGGFHLADGPDPVF